MKMEKSILHVEDNAEDALLTQMAFRKAGLTVKIEVARDGDAAIAALDACSNTGMPNCVLLDIKLPGKSGLEVLEWMRAQPRFRRLPVVMLTSSVLTEDINAAYDLGANSYLAKPPDLDSLTALVKTLYHYWFQTNTPPPTKLAAPVLRDTTFSPLSGRR
jgi:CheY-like chemotaxis protein